jgi:NAD(P)H dehydrogenase (quinone)
MMIMLVRTRLLWLSVVLGLMVPTHLSAENAHQDDTTILVAYYSRTGRTEQVAEAVAEGVRGVEGTRVLLKALTDVTAADLSEATGIVLGSPTYSANMAGPMKSFIDDWSFRYRVDLTDKVGAAFSTGGGHTAGKEHVVVSLLLAMIGERMLVLGPIRESGVGALGVSGVAPPPGEQIAPNILGEGRLLGARIAQVAQRVRLQP